MSTFATERAPATTTHSVAARLDRIPPFSLHRRMCVAVGFANFFDLYDIFLGGVLSNSFHIYQAEIFPTRMRTTAVGIAYSLSRLSGAILPFISVTMFDNLGATAVFLGSALIMVIVCVDVGVLGPCSTGLVLEDSADERARTRSQRFAREPADRSTA